MHHFCTLFDRNYLSRGLALYESLRTTSEGHLLTVLCLDEPTRTTISRLGLENIELLSIEELEAWDPKLALARNNRSRVEYYFTCKPVLMAYLVSRFPGIQRITYLDSDLYYFSSPRALNAELARTSVALTPHRFPDEFSERLKYGRYNAGWVSVAADCEGTAFIQWWRARCIEWCRMEAEPERFGDQKYLDRVPSLFPRARALVNPGANVAPWNLAGLALRASDQRLLINDEPLVFFHFHGLKKTIGSLYDVGLLAYDVKLTQLLSELVFRPYLESLVQWERRVQEVNPQSPMFHKWMTRPREFARHLKRALIVTRRKNGVFAPSRRASGRTKQRQTL